MINKLNSFKEYLRTHLSVFVIFVAIVIALVNYLIYPTFLNKKLNLVEVPIVKQQLKPNTKIEAKHISSTWVALDTIPSTIITDLNEVIGLYTKDQMSLVIGSFFYKEMLVNDQKMISNGYHDLKEGQYVYMLVLAKNNGMKEKVRKGQYVDLYFKAKDRVNDDELLIGKLYEHVLVLDTFINQNSIEDHWMLALDEEDVKFLIAAESLGEIYPMISNNSYNDDHLIETDSEMQAIKQYINSKIYQLGIDNDQIEMQVQY
ncbi:MAG: SAF domain-containing protein [Erysipelotrichaceae bacterium]|nr:SAF domain-containing protein [Erysipelotrichaceae bacterium]